MKCLLSKRAMLLNLILFSGVNITFSQNSPVSQSANSMVDMLTGNFKYSLPVMTVPGPNGEEVPIEFSYSGGIRSEEQSSWIGLGWNYNPGEISHSVNGVSDDWKNKTLTTTTYNGAASTPSALSYYGPLYYAGITSYTSATTKMDVNMSSYKQPAGGGCYLPDYDSYNVSGPGIGGVMSPKVYSFGNLFMGDQFPYTYIGGTKSPGTDIYFPSTSSKPVNFYFNDDNNQYNVAQHFGTYYGSNGTSSPLQYTASTNRINTGNYIEYFTNSQINAGVSGFLDYRIISGTRRPSADFDPDGIGAFQITTPEGMVYHYALPVYMLSGEKMTSFKLNSSFDIDAGKTMTQTVKDRYVVSWKLTAVTGMDYVDVNNNGIADIGDTGYWISYNYGEWCSNYSWRSPFYNFSVSQYNKHLPSRYHNPGYISETYEDEGTVNTGQVQSYYLNYIQTATHTAFFIKDVRLDNHGINEGTVGSPVIKPSLKLNKIVLVKNENIPLFYNTASLPYDSRFTVTGCFPNNVQPHIGNYNANDLMIKANSLETVELTSDYSLCKKLYNNINNTFTTTSYIYNSTSYPAEVYRKFDEVSGSQSTTDASNNGKLALKEVKIYAVGYKAATPSYMFDYDQSNAAKNPDYKLFMSDYWGYYKSDYDYTFRGRYTTEGTLGSYNNVDAWSLKKITTPLGGEISVDYESNKYDKVNYGQGYGLPERFFLVQSAAITTSGSSPWVLTVNKEIQNFISLSSLTYGEAFLPFTYGGTVTSMYNYASPPTFLSLVTGTGNVNVSGLTNAPSGSAYNSSTNGWGYIGLMFSTTYGGGARVKQVTFKDPDNSLSYINEYTYETGAAGAEPTDINVLTDVHTVGENKFAGDPMMPAPMVSYGKVTVKSKSLNNTYNGKTEYYFDNMFDPFTLDVPNATSVGGTSSDLTVQSQCTVKQLVGSFGRILNVKNYDNNNVVVSAEQYDYQNADPGVVPSVEETFTQKLKWSGGHSDHGLLYDLYLDMDYIKVQCKNTLKKKTSYKDGIYTTEEIVSRDPSTGMPIRVVTTDPTTGITDKRTDYAYLQTSSPDYSNMGTKSKDPTAKNMLLAPYKVTIYRDKIIRNTFNQLVGSGNLELIAGTKTTWQQNFPGRVFDGSSGWYLTQTVTSNTNWKPYQTFIFNGDVNDANWRQDGEYTLFNNRNEPIETKTGVANRYSASKLGYDQKFVLTKANDCKYTDFTFSGFEDQEPTLWGPYFGGEITQGQMRYAGDASVIPHTGNYVAKVDATLFGPTFLAKGFTKGRSYRSSVWVNKNSPSNAALVFVLDGTSGGAAFSIYKSILKSDASNITVGDWTLMTLTQDVPADFTETGGTYGTNGFITYLYNPGSTTAYYDDFMVRPIDADITGNIIDEKNGRTTAVLDKNNFATKYVYDDSGRIHEIWVETATDGWKLKTRYSYNFKRTY